MLLRPTLKARGIWSDTEAAAAGAEEGVQGVDVLVLRKAGRGALRDTKGASRADTPLLLWPMLKLTGATGDFWSPG